MLSSLRTRLAGEETAREERGDPHLRSTREVSGYCIGATDGEIGHGEDFVVDNGDWAIRYVVVATRSWLPDKKVLISPRWISEVSWHHREVYADLERAEIKYAPNGTRTRRSTTSTRSGCTSTTAAPRTGPTARKVPTEERMR